MAPPKCRLCGAAHWPREPHKGLPPALLRPATMAPRKPEACATCDALRGTIADLHAELMKLKALTANKPVSSRAANAPANSRAAYMREYMRKRRAK